MTVIIPCPQCQGLGVVVAYDNASQPRATANECPRCNGRGYLESTEMTASELLQAARGGTLMHPLGKPTEPL